MLLKLFKIFWLNFDDMIWQLLKLISNGQIKYTAYLVGIQLMRLVCDINSQLKVGDIGITK